MMKQVQLKIVLLVLLLPSFSSAGNLAYRGGETFPIKINAEIWSEQKDEDIKTFHYRLTDSIMKCGWKGTVQIEVLNFSSLNQEAIDDFVGLSLEDNFRLIFYSSRSMLIRDYPPGITEERNLALFPAAVTLGDDEPYQVALLSKVGAWEVRDGMFVATTLQALGLPELSKIFY